MQTLTLTDCISPGAHDMHTMQGAIYFMLIILSAAHLGVVTSSVLAVKATEFSVLNYGAVGDGKADDTQAFVKAWQATCSATTALPTMVIPKWRRFLVKQVTFGGPCKATNVSVSNMGTIISPDSPKEWDKLDATLWLGFKDVNGLLIDGYGTFDGRGSNWWKQSCRLNPKPGCTKGAPTVLKITDCKDVKVRNMKFRDSPQTHLSIMASEGVEMYNLNIMSPGDSPNTDGIHIHNAKHISVDHSTIGCGDDCVSIGDFIYDVRISRIGCGPGHGISVGSLGKDKGESSVEEIHVKHANFFGTTNGARIKTWQGGSGFVKSISFENLNFSNVQNPIVIDQYYCDVPPNCPGQSKAVKISDITYTHLHGTSATPLAISLNCSQSVSCDRLHFNNINITSADSKADAGAACINANGDIRGYIHPNLDCLHRN